MLHGFSKVKRSLLALRGKKRTFSLADSLDFAGMLHPRGAATATFFVPMLIELIFSHLVSLTGRSEDERQPL